jgi:hypothetical protein
MALDVPAGRAVRVTRVGPARARPRSRAARVRRISHPKGSPRRGLSALAANGDLVSRSHSIALILG